MRPYSGCQRALLLDPDLAEAYWDEYALKSNPKNVSYNLESIESAAGLGRSMWSRRGGQCPSDRQ